MTSYAICFYLPDLLVLSFLIIYLTHLFFHTLPLWEWAYIHSVWTTNSGILLRVFFRYFDKVVIQLLIRVQLFVTPWPAARQASLSTVSQSLLKFMSIQLMMPSNHLILCHPLLLLLSILPIIRVFSSELALSIKGPEVLELELQHQSFQCVFRVVFG